MTAGASPAKRAIGIVRVSEVGDRSDETFHSPEAQREAITRLCESKGWQLLDVHPEMNISGGATLENRPGLSRAVTAVLTNHAEVIVALDSSRLWRSTEVRQQVLRLVQGQGGEVWTAKDGELSQHSARAKFGGLVQTGADEMYREEIAEKSAEGQRIAASRNVPPMTLPPGLAREAIGTDRHGRPVLGPVVKTKDANAVAEAVQMRARGATIAAVREHLAAHGITRSYHGTQSLLRSPLLCGRWVFGKDRRADEQLSGTLPAIVDEAIWKAAQASQPRGRRPSSDRLLARLGILRCATCDSRMVVGTQRQNGRSYPFYRCASVREDCERRVTISATVAEQVVVDAARAHLDGELGLRPVAENSRDARMALAQAQDELDAAIRNLAPVIDEPTVVDVLRELRQVRDDAQARVAGLGDPDEYTIMRLNEDWNDLSLEDRRRSIRATIERVLVRPAEPGRSPEDRIEVIHHGGPADTDRQDARAASALDRTEGRPLDQR